MSAYLPHTARLETFLGLVDAAGLALAVWVAHRLRFDAEVRAVKLDELWANPGLLIWALLSGWALAIAAELYEPEVLHRRRESILRVLVMASAWATGIVLATYFQPSWVYGRGVLLFTTVTWCVLLFSSRWLFTSWLRRRARFPALVVGDPPAARQFCQELASRPSAPWTPVDGSGIAISAIQAEIEKTKAAIVILAGSDEDALEMGHGLTALHFSGVPVVAASEIWAWLEERLPLAALTPAIFLHQPGFGSVHWTLFNRLTRIADLTLASLLLIVTSPILLVGAAVVAFSDGFPVLYRQQRAGQYGRPFTIFKLRTMARDAEHAGPTFAAEKDPRTIPAGSFLRRFRVDELPQLVNVLRGEMSLVGPRPERPEFVATLSEEIPYYAFRLAVPPGLTGWAQVNTSYARTLDDHKRKLEFDLYFIRERSGRLYLLTLLRTASAALAGVRR